MKRGERRGTKGGTSVVTRRNISQVPFTWFEVPYIIRPGIMYKLVYEGVRNLSSPDEPKLPPKMEIW